MVIRSGVRVVHFSPEGSAALVTVCGRLFRHALGNRYAGSRAGRDTPPKDLTEEIGGRPAVLTRSDGWTARLWDAAVNRHWKPLGTTVIWPSEV